MYLKFFKFIPFLWLFLALVIPQQAFGQSDVEEILKRIEQGNYSPSSIQEKEMISEYLDNLQKSNNVSQESGLSPDATIFYSEDFTLPVLNENFNYGGTADPDITNVTSNWSRHSGSDGPEYLSTGLSYTDYFSSSTGGSIHFTNGSSGTNDGDVNRTFPSISGDTDTYTSFLLNLDSARASQDYFFHIAPDPLSFTYRGRLRARDFSTGYILSLSKSTGTVYEDTTVVFNFGQTYLVVLKYTMNSTTTTDDEYTLYVYSSGIPATEPGTPDLTLGPIGSGESGDLTNFGAVAVRQGTNTPTGAIDGIRVSSSWSDIFPTTGLPSGWTNVDNGVSGLIWDFTNPGGRTISADFDEDFAMMDSDDAGSGVTMNATLTTIAVNCAAATNVTLGFDQQFRALTGSYGLVEVSNDGTTWTLLDSITASTGYPNPPVHTEYDITSVAAGQSTVYARWTYDDAGTWAWWWAIDNVTIYEPDAEPLPASLVSPADAGTDIDINATLNWIAGGGAAPTGYRINFGTDNPPTNIENNTDLGLVTTYTPTSLSYSTTYYWEIIPYNGDGDATGTVVWSFTTMADPTISTFPWLEDFNSGTFPPDNWMRYGGLLADTVNLVTSSEWFEDDYLNNLGNTKSARTNIYGTTRDGWLMTPPIDLGTGTNYQLEFDLGLTDYANSNPPDNESGIDDKFAVVISTDGGATWLSANTLKLWDSTSTGGNYYYDISHLGQHEIIDLTGYTGVIMLGFYGESTVSNGDNDLFVENVYIQEIPATPIFSITPASKDYGDLQINTSSADQTFTISNIGVGTLTITSGNISIVGADAGQFVLTDNNTYPINLTTGQTATVDVNFSPTTVGAKTADLQIVDNTTAVAATQTVPLTGVGIDATITTFPYTEGFEGTTFPPTGWLNYGDKLWTEGSEANSGLKAARVSYTPAGTANLQTPPVVIPASPDHRIKFWWKDDDITTGPGNGVEIIGYDTTYFEITTDGGTTWTTISFLSEASPQSSYVEVIQDLSSYAGQTVSFRWRDVVDPAAGFSAYGVGLDDITIEESPAVVNPAVLVSPPDAGTDINIAQTLNWMSGGGAPELGYKINFGTDNPPTNIENDTDLGLVTTYVPASLAYSTTYYWEIIPYNGSGDATGTVVWSFTTQADPTISTFPYTEAFENGGSIPAGWEQDLTNTEDWLFGLSATYAASSDHTTGTGYMAWIDDSSPSNAYPSGLITPPMDISGLTAPTAIFYYWIGVGNLGPSFINVDVYNGTTWTDSVITALVENGAWAEVSVDLTSYISTSTKVRFRGFEDLLNFNTDLSIDDFSVFDNINPPNCALNVSPLDAATDVYVGTDLAWASDGGGPTGYILYFGTDNPPTNIVNGVDQGNVLTYTPATILNYSTTYYWQVIAYNDNGNATGCSVWSFTTQDDPTVSTFPFVETFEDDSPTRASWIQIQEAGSGLWTFDVGAGGGLITTAYEDSLNARFVSVSGTNSPVTKLVSPPLDISSVLAPTVYFAYGQEEWFGDQNQLKVYYRTSFSDPWVELAHYTDNVPAWTVTSLLLPNPSSSYQLAFEGINNWGRANVLDSVTVQEGPPNDVGTASIDLASGIAPGGVLPQATVKNFGSATQTFDVTMEISDTSGAVVYTSTKTVTSLTSGNTEQVTFDNWDASTLGIYDVSVMTLLVGDVNPGNDSLGTEVVVATGTWASGSPNVFQYFGGGVAVNGFLYSIAGNDALGATDVCYKYEVATDTWTQIASLPLAIRAFATANVGNFIYVMGGSDNASVYQSIVYKYDIVGDSWSTVTSLPLAIGFGKAVGYNNYVYFVGGYDGSSYLSTVYVYDTVADTWTPATSMPAGVFAGAFSNVGSQLVYVGGATSLGITDEVVVGDIDGVDPFTITWTTLVSPYPGINKEVQVYHKDDVAQLMLNLEGKRKGSPEESTYPPGAMFRFDASPWGTEGIIVAGGDNLVNFTPAIPNRCYVYTPGTDTWTVKFNVPSPILAVQMGTVNTGSTWKLVVAGGVGQGGLTDATQIFTDEVSGGSTFAFNVTVADGWNMVSVPGTNPAGMGVDTWWSGRDAGANVVKFAGGYQNVTTTTPTEGYWMKHVGPQTYNYSGIGIVPHNDVPLALGWNLIGLYENTVAVPLTTTPPGIITAGIFEYNGGYTTATSLAAGIAYWVKADAAGSITGLSAPPLGKANGEVVEYFQEDWGKIILTDASGINYTLYAVTGQVDLDKYELPPMPPAGMFDIRYGSGRIAEDINSSIQEIQMSGVTYPLTVRAEGMDMRLMDETGKTVNVNLKSGEDVVIGDATIQKLMVTGELVPAEYALEQNYPNPFNPSTTIEFSLPEDVSNVKLSIYNALGEKVAELVNGSLVAGKYQYQWNAKNVATGMYIYELRTDKFVSVKKMLLLK